MKSIKHFNYYELFRSYLSNLSIFKKIFYGIILIVLLIIGSSSLFLYNYSRMIYENEATSNVGRMVEIINKSFADNLDQVERIITLINADSSTPNSDSGMKEVISTKTYNGISDEYKALQITRDFFQQMIFLRKDFSSIYIYISKEKAFSYAVNGKNILDYNPVNEKWYKDTVKADGKIVILAPHIPYQLAYDRNVISFSRLLKNTEDMQGEPYGVVLLDLSLDSVYDIIDKVNLGNTTGVVFLDNDKNIIFTDNVASENSKLSDDIINRVSSAASGKFYADIMGKEFLVSFHTSNITGWKLITVTPYFEAVKGSRSLMVFSLLIVFFATVISILISYAFSKFISKPIRKLEKGISKVKEGNFDFQLKHGVNDELGQLVGSFNSMVLTIKKLILEKYEEELARKDAEFQYLQAQINPHFIYNTLQIISSMAVVKKEPEISKVSKGLAKMLRYSINNKSKIIMLKEEIENIISYLDIQKLRFKEFLNYEIDIESDILECRILKLVLQPVAENCITHGIEAKGIEGRIKISGRRINDTVCIEIWDNGAGMSAAEVEKLLEVINKANDVEEPLPSGNGHSNIGLKNINRRLKLIYGQEYGIDVESVKGEWTKVFVYIPVSTERGEAV